MYDNAWLAQGGDGIVTGMMSVGDAGTVVGGTLGAGAAFIKSNAAVMIGREQGTP